MAVRSRRSIRGRPPPRPESAGERLRFAEERVHVSGAEALGGERVERRGEQLEIAVAVGLAPGIGERRELEGDVRVLPELGAGAEVAPRPLGDRDGDRLVHRLALAGEEAPERSLEIGVDATALGELVRELVAIAFERGTSIPPRRRRRRRGARFGEALLPERGDRVVVRRVAAGRAEQHGEELPELVRLEPLLQLHLAQAVGEELVRDAIEGRPLRSPDGRAVVAEVRGADVEADRARSGLVRGLDWRIAASR